MLKYGAKLTFIVMYWIPTALNKICFYTIVENRRKTFSFSATYCIPIHLLSARVNGILLVTNIKPPSKKTQSVMSTAPVILPITAKYFRGLKNNIKTIYMWIKLKMRSKNWQKKTKDQNQYSPSINLAS